MISFSVTISFTRFSINKDSGLFVLSQYRTHCESENKIFSVTSKPNSFTINLLALTPIKTASNSSRGTVKHLDFFLFLLPIGTNQTFENKRFTVKFIFDS